MLDRHYLVVGGTRGIGLALVKYLISGSGNRVSVLGRIPAKNIQSPMLEQYSVDVSDTDSLEESLKQAGMRFGKVDCAVFMQRHRGGKADLEMDLRIALIATKCVIDYLIDKERFGQSGSLVFVSSIADQYIAPEQSLGYHVAKAGFSQMARYYALELGPFGIRVNSVSPCVVAKEGAKDFYDKNSWLVNRFSKAIPLGRMGKSEDIINAIMFLASEQASYITGQNLVVDGGLTLRSHESLIRDFPRSEQ